jgi:hypothetical protein
MLPRYAMPKRQPRSELTAWCYSRQGAGGQTGWRNPLAFVRAVRTFYNGPLVLAGGIATAMPFCWQSSWALT